MRSPTDRPLGLRLLACVSVLAVLLIGLLAPAGQAASPAGFGAGPPAPRAPGPIPFFCFLPPGSLQFGGSCGLPAANVSVSLTPSTVLADGTSTSQATATVTDAENDPVAGDTIVFQDTAGPSVTIGPVTDNGDGTYTATITAGTTAGQATITATDTSVVSSPPSGQATLTLNQATTVGPAANVSVGLSPASLVANGTSTATATATVTDANGNPVAGDNVSFTANPSAGVTIGPVTDNGNGTYSATITAGTTAEPVTITASDGSVVPNVSGQNTLTLTAGPATAVSVGLSASSLVADGTSTTTATATVTDANGNPVVGDNVSFTANPSAGVTIGPVTDNGNGTYSATITAGTTAEPVTITASDGSVVPNVSGQNTLTLSAGPATGPVGVVLTPNKINADGTSTSIATATVTDAHGNPVTGDTVQFTGSPNGDVKIGPTTDDGHGTYSATITAGTTAGSVTITATDSSVVPNATGQASLTLASSGGVGQAASVSVALNPQTITANGTSTTVATATVLDVSGNPVTGDTVQFTASPRGEVTIGPVTNNQDGTYSATITAGATAGSVTITATDISVTPQVTGSTGLTLNATSAANSLTVSVSPTAIPADGGASHAFATAAVQASDGSAVPNDTIQFLINDQPVGSECVTHSDGTCHITLNSTSVVERETITAYDVTADLLSSNSVYLWMVQVPTPPPTTTTPVQTAIATGKIVQSLAAVLRPTGTAASIKSLRKRGTYAFSYQALEAGTLTIDWYEVGSRKQKLIAAVNAVASKAGKVTARLKLTAAGRVLLGHIARLHVTANVSFAASGSAVVRQTAKFTLR